MTEEDSVIAALTAFTPLSVQTSAEATAVTNTDARLLYNLSTRVQGNFSLFYAQAKRDLTRDLVKANILLSTDDTYLAYAYLIWHYAIKKFPDWEAQSVSLGGDSVSRKPGITSAKAAYIELLKSSKKANQSTPTIGKVDDYTNYDERLNPANISMGRFPEGV